MFDRTNAWFSRVRPAAAVARQPASEPADAPPNADHPSPLPAKRQWRLAGLAWGLSLLAFFVPQRIPLEWYPLNEPGTDIHYLEIKCASDADGWVTLWYDITHGWSTIDQIRFPISPTEQTYTYTFPLPDAPLIGLRLDPVAKGGTLTVHHMRIINRRGEEIRNFPIESLAPNRGIASIKPLAPGWTITSAKNQTGPICEIEPFLPILPIGMNGRNVHRSLLSTGYLAGMLVILMLAVTSAFWRPADKWDFLGHILLLATIAIPFSAVGNRGLIRNSIRYALYAPVCPNGFQLEVDYQAEENAVAQLFWDTGTGYTEGQSTRAHYSRSSHTQTLRFRLPEGPLENLRFDPKSGEGTVRISRMRIVDMWAREVAPLPLSSLNALHDIASIRTDDTTLTIEMKTGAGDPIMGFSADAVDRIRQITDEEKSAR